MEVQKWQVEVSIKCYIPHFLVNFFWEKWLQTLSSISSLLLKHKTTVCLSFAGNYVHSLPRCLRVFCLLNTTPSDSVQPDNALLLRYRMSCEETQLWHQTWERELQSSWLLEALNVSDTWQISSGRHTDNSKTREREKTGSIYAFFFSCRRQCSPCTFPRFSSQSLGIIQKMRKPTSSAPLIWICNAHGIFFSLVPSSCWSPLTLPWYARSPRTLTKAGFLESSRWLTWWKPCQHHKI